MQGEGRDCGQPLVRGVREEVGHETSMLGGGMALVSGIDNVHVIDRSLRFYRDVPGTP